MNYTSSVSKPLFSLILLLACLLSVTGAQAQGNSGQRVTQKSPEHSNSVFNRDEALQQRKKVHDWLVAESVNEGLTSPISVRASDQEKAEIDQADRGESPFRVGLTKAVSRSVSFGDLRSSRINKNVLKRNNGAMVATEDGGYVYTASVNSPDATAMRLQFKGFRLADNTSLYLFTENGQVFGPYNGRGPHQDGEFWSHTLVGDHIIMQIRHKGPVSDTDLRNTAFQLTGVAHLRPRFLEGYCSWNEACVENAECATIPTAIASAQDAVAHMQWVSGPYVYMCSGGLIADTDAGSFRPLFLSANHCISRGKDARNLENYFQLTALCDTPSCDDIFGHRSNHPQSLRTLGATILSGSKNTDYTLFELKDPAPDGSAFLGWNSAPVAFTNGTSLYRIHHPGGSPQAYSEHVVDSNTGTCGGWPRGDRLYSRDTFGATEGGSSGSPVLNSQGEIVGQLTGACGYNLDDVCDSASNATVDGAFAAYFSSVESDLIRPCTQSQQTETSCEDGLDNDCDGAKDEVDSDCDSGNECTPDEIGEELNCDDGRDNDCDGAKDEADSDCDPGSECTPHEIGEELSCNDGRDNDCDGDVDLADSDCQPDLKGFGDTCTANEHCASGKCKGRNGAKTCK